MDDLAPDARAVIVNKRELTKLLRVSLPTLSNWMDRWPDFPVKVPGKNGVEWQFIVADVVAFLTERREEEAARKSDRDDELLKLQLSFDLGLQQEVEPVFQTRVPVKEQIELFKLNDLKLKQAERCRQLVKADDVADAFSMALAQIARECAVFVRQMGREQGWSDAQVRHAEVRFQDMQRKAVDEAMRSLEFDDAEPELRFA